MELAPITFFSKLLQFQAQIFQRIHFGETSLSDDTIICILLLGKLTKIKCAGPHNHNENSR